METGLSSLIKSLLLEEIRLFLLRPLGNSAAPGLARGDVSQTPHMHLCSSMCPLVCPSSVKSQDPEENISLKISVLTVSSAVETSSCPLKLMRQVGQGGWRETVVHHPCGPRARAEAGASSSLPLRHHLTKVTPGRDRGSGGVAVAAGGCGDH